MLSSHSTRIASPSVARSRRSSRADALDIKEERVALLSAVVADVDAAVALLRHRAS
jgi:hypothetical protein